MGSDGDFTKCFRGYSATQVINFGECGEPDDEAREWREREWECERSIRGQEPFLQGIYDHFIHGTPPYRGRLDVLDRDRAEVRPMDSDFRIRRSY